MLILCDILSTFVCLHIIINLEHSLPDLIGIFLRLKELFLPSTDRDISNSSPQILHPTKTNGHSLFIISSLRLPTIRRFFRKACFVLIFIFIVYLSFRLFYIPKIYQFLPFPSGKNLQSVNFTQFTTQV